MPNGDTKVYFQIEWSTGSGQWGWSAFQHKHDSLERAEKEMLEAREKDKHRDDKRRARQDECWMTESKSWKDYRSAATNYRLVKITRQVIDEDPNFDPMTY